MKLRAGRSIGPPGVRLDDSLRQISGILRGNRDALSELYDSTVPSVYGLIMSILGNAAEAEEVTCDVYTQVWHTATDFDPTRETALNWLLGIARRRALEGLR